MNTQPFGNKQISLIQQLRLRLRIVIGTLLLVLLLQLVVVNVVFRLQQNESEQQLTQKMTLETLLRSMIDQETGLRGYTVTVNPLFLEPFEQGRSQYLDALHTIRIVIPEKSFPSTVLALTQMERTAERWYTTFARVQLRTLQSGSLPGARSEQTLAQGKRLFDRFRQAVIFARKTLNHETYLLQQQEVWNNERLFLGLAFCSLAAISWLWFIFGQLAHDMKKQLSLLQQTIQDLGRGQLAIRLDPLKHVELHQVGQALNTMAQALLQQQQELVMHATLVEQASDYWALLNTVKTALLFVSPSNKVVVINQCFHDFFGIEESQILGHSLHELFALWRPLFADPASLQAFFANTCTASCTTTLLLVHPQIRQLEFQSLPVHHQKEQLNMGCLYMLRDITQERELDRLKSEFISTVSHEFRTALTGIQGFSEVICGMISEDQQEMKEFAIDINHDAMRLTALVSDLLDFDQMQSGTIELHPESLDLNALMKEVTAHATLTHSLHALQFDLDETLPPVTADRGRLKQAVTNILSNAITYSPNGGTILIRSYGEEVGVHLSIEDQGSGISAEALHHIFEPYSRIHAARTHYVEGVGLGLTLTKKIIQMHGGQIWVESQLGKGTCVHIMLPC